MTPPLTRNPAAIILDFDGVIVASVALKVQAFLTVYENEDAAKLQQILDYQREHGGVTSRNALNDVPCGIE